MSLEFRKGLQRCSRRNDIPSKGISTKDIEMIFLGKVNRTVWRTQSFDGERIAKESMGAEHL